MAYELVYTSAEQGLKPRAHGFCTVAMTAGLSPNVVERLENISGYRAFYAAHDPNASKNPVNYSFYRFKIGGRSYAIVSRVCFAGFDYTGRSNKLAHHVVLDDPEQLAAGPTALGLQPSFFLRDWSGAPRENKSRKPVPSVRREPAVSRAWQSVTGDAGWAGVVAEHSLKPDAGPVVLVVQPELSSETVLRLLDEVTGLVPPARRWDMTFSTYLTDLPMGTTCMWRCVLAGSPELEKVRRTRGALVLDLTTGLGAATGGNLVAAARSGADPYPQEDAEIPLVLNVRPELTPGRGRTRSSSDSLSAPSAGGGGIAFDYSLLMEASEDAALATVEPPAFNRRRYSVPLLIVSATLLLSVLLASLFFLNRRPELTPIAASTTIKSPPTNKNIANPVPSTRRSTADIAKSLAVADKRSKLPGETVHLGDDSDTLPLGEGISVVWTCDGLSKLPAVRDNTSRISVQIPNEVQNETLRFKVTVSRAGDLDSSEEVTVLVRATPSKTSDNVGQQLKSASVKQVLASSKPEATPATNPTTQSTHQPERAAETKALDREIFIPIPTSSDKASGLMTKMPDPIRELWKWMNTAGYVRMVKGYHPGISTIASWRLIPENATYSCVESVSGKGGLNVKESKQDPSSLSKKGMINIDCDWRKELFQITYLTELRSSDSEDALKMRRRFRDAFKHEFHWVSEGTVFVQVRLIGPEDSKVKELVGRLKQEKVEKQASLDSFNMKLSQAKSQSEDAETAIKKAEEALKNEKAGSPKYADLAKACQQAYDGKRAAEELLKAASTDSSVSQASFKSAERKLNEAERLVENAAKYLKELESEVAQ